VTSYRLFALRKDYRFKLKKTSYEEMQGHSGDEIIIGELSLEDR